jgi:succinate-semialdehyde dehydrogenase / glutarate-semialdehyde dehydrogenase
MVLRQPIGVAVAITPWNFPVAMIARKLAPGLAAGCTMIVKPAEQTPLSAIALFEAIEEAELPPGVVNLVTASNPEEIARPLLRDKRVRKITFTGSTEVGRILLRASAEHLARVSLELGGQAPFIVFEDADLDAAVAGVLASKFQLNGQSCLCANRVFVHSDILEDFTSRLTAAVATLKVGPGSDPSVSVGPLIDGQGFDKVQRHVEVAVERGAQVMVGGRRVEEDGLDRGYSSPRRSSPLAATTCS